MEEVEAVEMVHCLEKCENANHSIRSSMKKFCQLRHQPYTLRRICNISLAKLLLTIATILGITLMAVRSKTSLMPSSSDNDYRMKEGSIETSESNFQRPNLQFHHNKNCRQSNNNNYEPKGQEGDQGDSHYCFKILQIADIHLGEAENLDWGPEQDRKTWIVLDSVIQWEQPDLIILSGDQLTGNNCKENATAYYQMLGEFLSKYNTPWVTIFGNHDDLGFVDPKTGRESPEPKFNRSELMEVDRSFPLSLSKAGPSDVFGTSNYVLDILQPPDKVAHHGHNTTHHGEIAETHRPPAAQVFLFDSGGGSLPEVIDETQLKWLEQKNQGRSIVPAVAFQHIPTLNHAYSQMKCTGMDGDNGMSPLESDAGIVPALVQAKRFLFLAVGHNHGNDYCCPYNEPTSSNQTTKQEEANEQSFYLCFGRHSGYGGYGKWERGARVYELNLRQGETKEMLWKSWVRLESGDIVDSV